MNIYQENGFKNRQKYLYSLAEQFENLDQGTIDLVADLLGPDEDFDGLIVMLEDFNG